MMMNTLYKMQDYMVRNDLLGFITFICDGDSYTITQDSVSCNGIRLPRPQVDLGFPRAEYLPACILSQIDMGMAGNDWYVWSICDSYQNRYVLTEPSDRPVGDNVSFVGTCMLVMENSNGKNN